jgi:hypothetical protein
VTAKLIGYLKDEIGGDEESSCSVFNWGLIPGIFLGLLKERINKLEYPILGQL